MMSALSIEVQDWPEIDKQRWHDARFVTTFLSGSRPAAHWSTKRRRIVEQAYGQWLAFLLKHGELDPSLAPQDRVNPARIEAFVLGLQQRVAPWSVVMMLQATQRMLVVLAPGKDWSWMRAIVAKLKFEATRSRDRRGHMVAPDQLYELGLSMMVNAEALKSPHFRAPQFRDGLMIAMLICAPVRIFNLHSIVVGKNLRFEPSGYVLIFESEEIKTKREYVAHLPVELTPMIDMYLQVHRKFLLRRDATNCESFWISREGEPMKEASMREQIKHRTRVAFGKHVWPHLFRAIAATGFVDSAPESISLAADLLGHASSQTTEKYYILAKAKKAHDSFVEALTELRQQAMLRLNQSKKGFDAYAPEAPLLKQQSVKSKQTR